MLAFIFPGHFFLHPSLTWCHFGVRWWCNQPTNQPTNQPIDQPTINQPTHLARARRLLEWLEVFGCMPNPRCTRSCNNLSLIQRPRILFKCSNLWIRKKSSSPELDFQKYKYWKIYFISQHFAEIPTRSVIVYNVWGFLDVTPEGVTCARRSRAHVTPSGVTSKNPHTLYCLR